MKYAAKSHIGLVRQINEDEFALHVDLDPYQVVLVADGMGGHLAGEIASSIAVEVAGQYLREKLSAKTGQEAEPDLSDSIVEAILLANEEIFRRGQSTSGYSGMGTTIVAGIVSPHSITMGYIGDSRGYLIKPEGIRQLTDDHSLVNELYKNGQLTEEEVNSHPQRNILTRALGTDQRVEVDLINTRWKEGDILLLCTDGLTNLVSDEEIEQVMKHVGSLEEKIDKLIERALEEGGTDNITVVALQNTGREKRGETQ
ncbi:Stp1/IreP family PP2C-type Ser/Thr phosphatase [Effusibacillus lacus]|uniref:Serine/threonine protein phosphatase n=1 Tax=Effusibacillus lacus TaxID=1348429 RepID=A0A292YND4_9BACL|nr:Stp1/IreP family PP2C-type Ser/Thr phosphatase [Effusibacillus lacus]TCS76559.1 protein phosphatase [Effusibacillus lacus]GAX90421.1 serine/threonine protein phosphatase [Effusibacillus lacus]